MPPRKRPPLTPEQDAALTRAAQVSPDEAERAAAQFRADAAKAGRLAGLVDAVEEEDGT